MCDTGPEIQINFNNRNRAAAHVGSESSPKAGAGRPWCPDRQFPFPSRSRATGAPQGPTPPVRTEEEAQDTWLAGEEKNLFLCLLISTGKALDVCLSRLG